MWVWVAFLGRRRWYKLGKGNKMPNVVLSLLCCCWYLCKNFWNCCTTMNWGTFSYQLLLIGKNQESRPFLQQCLFITTNQSKIFQIGKSKRYNFSIWTVKYMLTKMRKKMRRNYRCLGRKSKCFMGIRLKSILIGRWGRKDFQC